MFTSLGESWDLTSSKPRLLKIRSGNTGSRHGKIEETNNTVFKSCWVCALMIVNYEVLG